MTFFLKTASFVALSLILSLIPQAIYPQERLDSIIDGDFVTASLLVAEPGNELYAALGHCALRMECPSELLDYCFTLEANTEMRDHWAFFNGKLLAAMIAVPTQEYLEMFAGEGRGVKQYELHLNIREKQQLWKHLDEEIMKTPYLRFNFLDTNCMTMAVSQVEQSLIDERLDFSAVPAWMHEVNGERIRHYTVHAPWLQWICITLFGVGSDQSYQVEHSMSPTAVEEVFGSTSIVNSQGEKRSMLTGQPATLVESGGAYHTSPLTPRIVFGILLLWVIFVTVLEWCFQRRKAADITDTVLLIAQTFLGFFLLYFSFVANLFGTRWNWYLIPQFPLPVFIWLCFHRRKGFHRVYLFYSMVLFLFILATPLSSQLDWDHQLITASLLIRCLSRGRGVKGELKGS